MPGQRYRMTIGGVDAADGARVTATDPLTGSSLPVKVVSGTGDSIEVEMRVTDSPRLLTIQETAPSTGVTGLSQGPVPSRDVAPGLDVVPGRADAPSVRIRSHALRGLLATRRMSVFISCPSRCDPWARGRLMAGGRAFPATPVWYRRGVVGDRATIRLAIGARAARAGRRARRLGNRVHARITAMTHVDGSASALRKELRLRPPSH
jgi:hypothetical protein